MGMPMAVIRMFFPPPYLCRGCWIQLTDAGLGIP